jgi:hypothetical protein
MTTCRKALLLLAMLLYAGMIWILAIPGVTVRQVFFWLTVSNFVTFVIAVIALLRKEKSP